MKSVNGEYLKPLLRVSKSDLVDYLTRSGLRWMEDPSNAKREYKRNRVRLDLVPLLEDLAGGKAALDRCGGAVHKRSLSSASMG
jgi:tRNA(Ile)-lysidine synthase TilS/MesJ